MSFGKVLVVYTGLYLSDNHDDGNFSKAIFLFLFLRQIDEKCYVPGFFLFFFTTTLRYPPQSLKEIYVEKKSRFLLLLGRTFYDFFFQNRF